jgi:hypothetical protein
MIPGFARCAPAFLHWRREMDTLLQFLRGKGSNVGVIATPCVHPRDSLLSYPACYPVWAVDGCR